MNAIVIVIAALALVGPLLLCLVLWADARDDRCPRDDISRSAR